MQSTFNIVDLYTYRIEWSHEDSEYLSTCDEFPALKCWSNRYNRALDGIYSMVDRLTHEMMSNGEIVPIPSASVD